jgi:hypothetical protein
MGAEWAVRDDLTSGFEDFLCDFVKFGGPEALVDISYGDLGL